MFKPSLRKYAVATIFTAVAFVIAGCNQDATFTSTDATPHAVALPELSGTAHGGNFPVSGASVKLWYPGVTGYGSASNLLATTTTSTDGTGSFNFANTTAYTCPASDMPLYVTITGGDPGLASTGNWMSSSGNSYIALAAYIGTCGAPYSGVIVNEATTIGLAFATSQFSGASQAANGVSAVNTYTVTNGGNSFSSTTATVTFTGGGCTVEPTAAALPVTSGAVATGTYNTTGYGTGCTSAPTVTISGTGGMGVAATASYAAVGGSGSVGGTTIGSVSGTTAGNGGNIGAPIGTITSGALTVTNTLAYTNLKNAFATVNNLVDPFVGLAGPIFPTNIGDDLVGPYSTSRKINTLADVLATCVQSDGVAADGSQCASMAAVGTGVTPTGKTVPTDTFQMAQYLALSPSTNVSAVYGFRTGQPIFSPVTSSAPFDWTLAIGYTGIQNTTSAASFGLLAPAVDAKGQVWIAGTTTGGIFAIGPTGSVLNSGAAYTDSGAMSGPTEITIDASGNVWAANSGSASNSVIEYNPTSNTYNKYTANTSPTCGSSGLTLDPNYNFLFTCVKETSSPAYPLNALLNTGTVASPTYSATSTVGNTATSAAAQVFQIESDTSGNIWVPISSTKAAAIEMTPSTSDVSPTSYTAGTPNQSNTASAGGGLVIDHAGQIWWDATQNDFAKLNGSTVTNVTGSGTSGGGQLNSAFMAIDGAGDIWMANASGTVLGTGSSAVKYFTVSAFNNSASGSSSGAITPAAVSGTAPGGYAHNYGQPKYLAIDGSGNVWVPNYQTSGIITSYQITSSTSVTINGTSLTAGFFPNKPEYVTLYGFPTSTFLNGLTFTTPSSTNTAGSYVLTLVSGSLTAGSTVTENGYVNIGSGIAPPLTEIVGAAVPVYTPLGTAAALNKQAVLP